MSNHFSIFETGYHNWRYISDFFFRKSKNYWFFWKFYFKFGWKSWKKNNFFQKTPKNIKISRYMPIASNLTLSYAVTKQTSKIGVKSVPPVQSSWLINWGTWPNFFSCFSARPPRNFRLPYFETSACTSTNVEKSVDCLLDLVMQRIQQSVETSSLPLSGIDYKNYKLQ